MANISVQDIEAVDDYWGPTFRSILEGNACDSLSEQLDSRIRSHDKDIERICNLYYQGFIESIRELLQVRSQAKHLNEEVLALDTDLQTASAGVLSKGKELVRARQIESNIANAINGLSNCLPVLECYTKLLEQVKEKRYYPALKTLESLENDLLPKVSSYRFAIQMKENVPKLKENIKKSSESDFREFLENIREFSPKIGEVAMRHTRQLQKRNLSKIIEDFKNQDRTEYAGDEEELSVQDLIDFSPVYRCLHIYTVLNDKEYFEKDYRQQRKDQAKLVLQPPQGMHDNLEAYKTYIYSIVGFFVVEDHVKNTAGDVVTKSYLDELWTTSLTRIVNDLSMSSSSCTDPNILLRIKNLIMLSISTLKSYGYSVNPLLEMLVGMRDHYNEVLLQRWVHVFREILDKGNFLPLEVEDQEEYDDVIERFPFHSEVLESKPFPKTFPFSKMVPEVYHQAKEFMYACMKFSEELTLSPTEVAAMVRKAANLLLTRSFSGCLLAVFRNPSVALMQLIQIIIDTQYLEKAGPFLDDFVCKMTGTEQSISQAPSAMFHVARSDAEKQVSERICSKLDEFFDLSEYDWLLIEPHGNASAFVTDMISFLKSTFQSFAYLLPNVAQTACRRSCEHIANKIYDMLLTNEIKQISTGALQQINLDLMQCEFFAASEPVPGFKEGELSRYFAKIRQLLDLLIMEEWSTYLHDYGKVDNRYNLVQPSAIIIILEKIREADKKTMFSVLKKSERDKKKLWETVLKQLRQLADKQN
ncbi:exocyst complex component 6 [Condylostylus longicornis]|uniref:exocyst complex component 6 n=1 Tax=Condylostylus longicornis TaxID=2530218 RepID=UPI00244DAE8C|nr:exocyst complex component 6 [Condylostylus longicornis]XP_055377608.1 exocyst complex component 6 [Condylostylus longicornis]